MIGRHVTRPRARKLRALALLLCAPAAVAVTVISISAPASARSHSHPSRAITLTTLEGNVGVRSGPSTTAHLIGHISPSGTTVTVDCYVYGGQVAGNPVWYRVSRPLSGYLTSYYMDSHYDPVRGVRRCRPPQFRRTYHALVRGVHIRYWPAAFAQRLATLGRVGTRVSVNCYTYGQDIQGDRVWYHVVRPMAGYVAGLHLNTGRDPASGVPRC
ncbi:MAG TPA: hypothetical protein VEL03_06960 [Streptosporangiaceae bacterium]|nr:hypothetical protein [Streptosporangiaceae bacterium]